MDRAWLEMVAKRKKDLAQQSDVSGKSSEAQGPRLATRRYEAHSLAGILILVLMFITILTGKSSFFRAELEAWHIPVFRVEKPERFGPIKGLLLQPP